MDLVLELLSSGDPLLVGLGITISIAGPGYYLYIRQLRRQKEFWKEKAEDRLEKIQSLKDDRQAEVQASKKTLEDAKRIQEKFIDELKKRRSQRKGGAR